MGFYLDGKVDHANATLFSLVEQYAAVHKKLGKHGFILRYPEDAEAETGYAWHPWHYRYVGEAAAGNIHSLGITLEEYLSMFFSEEAAVVYDKS